MQQPFMAWQCIADYSGIIVQWPTYVILVQLYKVCTPKKHIFHSCH